MLSIWLFVPAHAGEWAVLQTDQVGVRCREVAGRTECEATARLAAPLERVCGAVRDLGGWPAMFESVRSARSVGDQDWAVEVRLPFPLGSRRFVAHVDHDEGPGSDPGSGPHVIVLTQVEGEAGLWTRASWALRPISGGTELTYTWHTDALSALPDWIRRPLLRRAGHNTVWGVALALGTEPDPPPPAAPDLTTVPAGSRG